MDGRRPMRSLWTFLLAFALVFPGDGSAAPAEATSNLLGNLSPASSPLIAQRKKRKRRRKRRRRGKKKKTAKAKAEEAKKKAAKARTEADAAKKKAAQAERAKELERTQAATEAAAEKKRRAAPKTADPAPAPPIGPWLMLGGGGGVLLGGVLSVIGAGMNNSAVAERSELQAQETMTDAQREAFATLHSSTGAGTVLHYVGIGLVVLSAGAAGAGFFL
jgi:flagellar biosynthesis GTPase FlhF